MSGPAVLGVIGALAGGKSTVARLLAERGARVIDADRIAHEVLERPEVRQAVKCAFGEGVFEPDGRVSRQKLAEAAFAEEGRVQVLNGIVHPPAIAEMRAQTQSLKAEPDVPLVVVDAALLTETGLDEELCDAVLFVEAPRAVRLARATEQRGLSAGQVARRERAQMPEGLKRSRATYVVSNAGSLEELQTKVDELWPRLVAGKREATDDRP